MKLGEFLKRYRQAKHMSGRQLADAMGISKYRLQKWEDAGLSPKAEDAEKIKGFFGIRELADASEELLNSMIKNEAIQSPAPLEILLKQKDDLLKEKDMRIIELNRTITILEEALEVYKTKNKGGK